MHDAACKGLTHLFFPSSAERPQARERREATARQVCATCAVTRLVPGVRPAAPRVRLLGWRERGRAPRRRLPPDRADRRPRPRRLTRPRRSRGCAVTVTRSTTSASSAAPTSTSSPPRRASRRPGETVLGHRLRRARRRQGPQPGRRRRPGRRHARRSSAAVGDDDAGRRLRRRARRRPAPTPSLVAAGDRPTGRARDHRRRARRELDRRRARRQRARSTGSPLPPCRVVLAQLEIPLDAVADALRRGPDAAGAVDDPQPGARRAASTRPLLALVDVAGAQRARAGRARPRRGAARRRRPRRGDDARRRRRARRDRRARVAPGRRSPSLPVDTTGGRRRVLRRPRGPPGRRRSRSTPPCASPRPPARWRRRARAPCRRSPTPTRRSRALLAGSVTQQQGGPALARRRLDDVHRRQRVDDVVVARRRGCR